MRVSDRLDRGADVVSPAAGVSRPPPGAIRSSFLVEFRAFALDLKLDPIALMKRAGIPSRAIEGADPMVCIRAVNDLFEITSIVAKIPDFGLRFGKKRGLPDLGPVTLMLSKEDTLRGALQTLVAFIQLHSSAAFLRLREGDEPVLTIELVFEGSDHSRQLMDSSVARVTKLIRWLLGADWNPAGICFAHSPPASVAIFNRFFRCPVYFCQGFNGIVLKQAHLEANLPSHSPAIRTRAAGRRKSPADESGEAFVQRLTHIIGLALSRGEVRVDLVSSYMGTDARTLNRRLSKLDLNYSAVLESVRRDAVMQHLRDNGRPLSDIAGLLGFGSLSAFSTWFHHAFHCAPSVWRKGSSGRIVQ